MPGTRPPPRPPRTARPVKSLHVNPLSSHIKLVMCDHPGCGSLASGVYYQADGTTCRRCTLHIPQAPAEQAA